VHVSDRAGRRVLRERDGIELGVVGECRREPGQSLDRRRRTGILVDGEGDGTGRRIGHGEQALREPALALRHARTPLRLQRKRIHLGTRHVIQTGDEVRADALWDLMHALAEAEVAAILPTAVGAE
jgi:hypothetical protein